MTPNRQDSNRYDSNRYDAIVIGGGHNGLVAGGYLAKGGAKTIVLEARYRVGGAATTEQPWGPDWKVTSLSYVVSLMPPGIVKDLNLEKHGYKVYPQDGYFMPQPGGDDALALGGKTPAEKKAEVARFSKKDADALERWDAWLGGLGAIMGPLLSEKAPKVGSRRPGDLLEQGSIAWRMRKLGVRGVADVTRLLTMSISDLLDDWFESDAVKAMLAVSGVIGTWAGPAEPGTAYVMLHHHIGDLGDGEIGKWGFPEGGMGGVSDAIAGGAREMGAEIRTDASVDRIIVENGKAVGVALRGGEELRAPIVVTSTHPKIAFLDHLEAKDLPEDFRQDIERWNTRSGVVKVNLALSELPVFKAHPEPAAGVHGGTIVMAPTVDYIEQAFQDARAGMPAEHPFADSCIPSFFDKTIAPEGKHILSMFTQWVPHTWADDPKPEELDAYADRVIDHYSEFAPNIKSAIIDREVIGPHEMQEEYGLIGGNIFHGELSPEQLFHLRPAPGYADYRTPIRGLYQCGSATHGGGGVTGIPGRNVVGVIKKDKRRLKLRGASSRS